MPLAPALLANPPHHFEIASSRAQPTTRRATFPAGRVSLRHQTVPVTATILTKDSAARIEEVLTALAWCDEVIVFDTGSTDATIALAQQHANVRVYAMAGPFPGFGRVRRTAIGLAKNDWILSVDSDEVVTPELAAEIAALELDPATVYVIPFENYFNGRHITTCGWAPDRHERLFHRGVTNFCESEVHERVQTAGVAVEVLKYPILHYSYDSTDDFLRKMRRYGQLFAEQHAGRKKTGPLTAVSRGTWAFVKSYILQRGVLQGYEGLVISAYKSQTVFWKYLLLHEANRRLRAA